MTFLIIWGGLWAALFSLVLAALAATPTTLATPNKALVAPAIWTGGIGFVLALTINGAINLISGLLP